MGEILKFPVRAAKFGCKRVPKRARCDDNPAQLQLFSQPAAEVLQFTPDLGRFEYALLLDERGDPRATDIYLKAIAERDCVSDAFCNLGVIESKQGNIAKAFDYFTSALKHNPRHLEAQFNLGNMYFEVNDFRLAQIHYEIAAEIDPAFPSVFFNLALVRSINNEIAAAVTALMKYRDMVPPDDRRDADELLVTLRKSLPAGQDSRARG